MNKGERVLEKKNSRHINLVHSIQIISRGMYRVESIGTVCIVSRAVNPINSTIDWISGIKFSIEYRVSNDREGHLIALEIPKETLYSFFFFYYYFFYIVLSYIFFF